MRFQHLPRIHPVHVIGAKDDDMIRGLVIDQVQRLVDRIRAALVPTRAEALLSGDRRDVLPRIVLIRQVSEMCRSKECDLYCVSTQIRSIPR